MVLVITAFVFLYNASLSSSLLSYVFRNCFTLGAVSSSIQEISSGETKCHVGRNMCVRRIDPLSNSFSIFASVEFLTRRETAHFAAAKSCDCTAPRCATASAAVLNVD